MPSPSSIIDSLFPTRDGKISCPCSSVQFHTSVPGTSYALMEQTTAHCHCKDCLGFARSCKNGEVVIVNNATQFVQFYKSDIKAIKPTNENIGRVRLREDSIMIRCYCKICGTPIGAEVDGAPVMLVYAQLIKSGTVHISNLILNFRDAEPGTRDYSRRVVVRKGMFCPLFFVRLVIRIIIGFLFGKGNGGFLNGQYEDIPVGLKSVEENKIDLTKKSEMNTTEDTIMSFEETVSDDDFVSKEKSVERKVLDDESTIEDEETANDSKVADEINSIASDREDASEASKVEGVDDIEDAKDAVKSFTAERSVVEDTEKDSGDDANSEEVTDATEKTETSDDDFVLKDNTVDRKLLDDESTLEDEETTNDSKVADEINSIAGDSEDVSEASKVDGVEDAKEKVLSLAAERSIVEDMEKVSGDDTHSEEVTDMTEKTETSDDDFVLQENEDDESTLEDEETTNDSNVAEEISIAGDSEDASEASEVEGVEDAKDTVTSLAAERSIVEDMEKDSGDHVNCEEVTDVTEKTETSDDDFVLRDNTVERKILDDESTLKDEEMTNDSKVAEEINSIAGDSEDASEASEVEGVEDAKDTVKSFTAERSLVENMEKDSEDDANSEEVTDATEKIETSDDGFVLKDNTVERKILDDESTLEDEETTNDSKFAEEINPIAGGSEDASEASEFEDAKDTVTSLAAERSIVEDIEKDTGDNANSEEVTDATEKTETSDDGFVLKDNTVERKILDDESTLEDEETTNDSKVAEEMNSITGDSEDASEASKVEGVEEVEDAKDTVTSLTAERSLVENMEKDSVDDANSEEVTDVTEKTETSDDDFFSKENSVERKILDDESTLEDEETTNDSKVGEEINSIAGDCEDASVWKGVEHVEDAKDAVTSLTAERSVVEDMEKDSGGDANSEGVTDVTEKTETSDDDFVSKEKVLADEIVGNAGSLKDYEEAINNSIGLEEIKSTSSRNEDAAAAPASSMEIVMMKEKAESSPTETVQIGMEKDAGDATIVEKDSTKGEKERTNESTTSTSEEVEVPGSGAEEAPTLATFEEIEVIKEKRELPMEKLIEVSMEEGIEGDATVEDDSTTEEKETTKEPADSEEVSSASDEIKVSTTTRGIFEELGQPNKENESSNEIKGAEERTNSAEFGEMKDDAALNELVASENVKVPANNKVETIEGCNVMALGEVEEIHVESGTMIEQNDDLVGSNSVGEATEEKDEETISQEWSPKKENMTWEVGTSIFRRM